MAKTIFSGEPLPIAPKVDSPELAAFHAKVIDYLRRLGAKLSQYIEGQGGAEVETFASYKLVNQANSATLADITWTRDLWKDSPYEHSESTDPESVGILLDGMYVVLVDLEYDASTTFPVEANLVIENLSAEGIVNFSLGAVNAAGTLSRAIPLPLIEGVSIRVQSKDSAGTGNVLARGSRLTVLRVAETSSGGSSPTPGTGWNGTSLPDWATAIVPP